MAAYPAGFVDGVRHFNEGRFFEAHEAFEELLDEVEDDDAHWRLLVALVQVAVGYHKCVSGNPGAERMLAMGAEKLAGLAEVAYGVRVGALRARVAEDLAAGEGMAERVGREPPRLTLGKG